MMLYIMALTQYGVTDLERFIRVVDKAHDVTTVSQKVFNQNLDSSNHDPTSTALYSQTNLSGPATHYAPSAAGQAFGDRNKVGWIVGIRDVDFDLEVSNDGTNWENVTASLVDNATTLSGYDNTYFTEPDVATVYFAVSYLNNCGFRLYRFVFTTGDATNVANIYPFSRSI